MSEVALFVGGPLDGVQREVHDHMPVYLCNDPPKISVGDWESQSSVSPVKQSRYIRHRFQEGSLVYVHENIHPFNVISHLVRGYRTNPL